MPHIKLVVTNSRDINRDDYGGIMTWTARDITDWEEVSDADLAFLKKNLPYLLAELKPQEYGAQILVLEQDMVPVSQRIEELKTILKDKLAKEEADRQEQLANRKKAKELQRAAVERKMLAELAEKHGIALPKET